MKPGKKQEQYNLYIARKSHKYQSLYTVCCCTHTDNGAEILHTEKKRLYAVIIDSKICGNQLTSKDTKS